MRRRHAYSATGLLLLSLLASGCSTTRLLKKQRLALLTSEYTYLQKTRATLQQAPNPELKGDGSIFVSQATLNAVLAAADGASGPIPSVSGATFHVDSVRAAFTDGLPVVTVKAWAEKPSDKLRVDMSVSAAIEPLISPNDPSKLLFKVHVTDVVPIAKWHFFQFHLRGFVRKLIQAKLAEYAEKLPDTSLPLRNDLALSLPTGRLPAPINTDDGQVQGAISIPGLNYSGALVINDLLFLSDGVHILFSVKASSIGLASSVR